MRKITFFLLNMHRTYSSAINHIWTSIELIMMRPMLLAIWWFHENGLLKQGKNSRCLGTFLGVPYIHNKANHEYDYPCMTDWPSWWCDWTLYSLRYDGLHELIRYTSSKYDGWHVIILRPVYYNVCLTNLRTYHF